MLRELHPYLPAVQLAAILLSVCPVHGQALVITNAKIVTVSDSGFTDDLGNVAEAMAVEDGKIVAVGSNSLVTSRARAGTTVIDLKGRTVLPGLIGVHEHPYDWTMVNPYILKKFLTDDVVVTRILDGSPEEQLKAFATELKGAVAQARPGQWIYMVFTLGRNYEYSSRGNAGLGGIPGQYPLALFGAGTGRPPEIAKEHIDAIAPNNPVLLRDVFTQLVLNSRGLEEIAKVFPKDVTSQINHDNGIGGADPIRWVFTDVVMRQHYAKLREMTRLGLNWWAGYGMTAYGSALYSPSNTKIFTDLSQADQMAMRSMWTWNWRNGTFFGDEYFTNMIVAIEGQGSQWLWNGGSFLVTGLGCSAMEPLISLPASQLRCGLPPGSEEYKLIYKYIKAGGRYATAHFSADRDVDNFLDIVEGASKEAGFSRDDIQRKRHAFDHLPILRPDQLKRIKDLGMIVGGNSFEIYQSAPGVLKVYGEKALDWVVPKRSLVDAGIPNGFEVDRALESTDLTIFWALARFIDRKAWDGKVYGEKQKLGRELALKTATTWGASYLLREDTLGSLEVGKWGDFIVLDRDYLKVPEADIANIRVLMTVVGGKIVHLVPSIAKEVGMQPVGAQVEFGRVDGM